MGGDEEMNMIHLKTQCENCGGDAYVRQSGYTNVVIMEFLEEIPCECGAETFLMIDKRVENS